MTDSQVNEQLVPVQSAEVKRQPGRPAKYQTIEEVRAANAAAQKRRRDKLAGRGPDDPTPKPGRPAKYRTIEERRIANAESHQIKYDKDWRAEQERGRQAFIHRWGADVIENFWPLTYKDRSRGLMSAEEVNRRSAGMTEMLVKMRAEQRSILLAQLERKRLRELK